MKLLEGLPFVLASMVFCMVFWRATLRVLTLPIVGSVRALVWASRPLARFSVRGLTDLAALLAGRKRPALRAEWRAHLAGESGHDLVTWQKVREALGFVASAVRCRCSDAAEAAWTPVDAVLKSRTLSNLFTLMPTALAALTSFRHGGTVGLLGSAGSTSTIGVALYGLVRVGRWWRNVKPPAGPPPGREITPITVRKLLDR